jgi:membrane protease subunit HflC
MLSEADRNSRIVHGEADGAASNLLSDAFGKDPVFYRFFRSLQSYRRSVADSGPLLMLSPDEGFLSVMKSGPPPTGKANP